MRLQFFLCCLVGATISACGGGSSSKTSEGNDCSFQRSAPPAITDGVTISGNITYDFVPHAVNGALSFANTERRPARGVTVQFLDASCNVVGLGKTDDLGSYAITAPSNTELKLRVVAEIVQDEVASWRVAVTDNTAANAIYVLDGSLINSGSADGVRNLYAPSGWSGSQYSAARRAAPFAILDSVYQAIQLLLSADAAIALTPMELRWSSKNIPVDGNLAAGAIGTSFYDGRNIYLLGDAEGDSDEFDRSVVQHEFGHYLEDKISRSDSIGGSHGSNSRLDMRVAFSEGFGNAFAAIASGTGYYEDSSFGLSNFRFSLENNPSESIGWFSENSAGLIIYDVFDAEDDGSDTISLGFDPIYDALTSSQYREGLARTSIFSFITALKEVTALEVHGDINDLLAGQDIYGTDSFGAGESNDAGSIISLPVYSQLAAGGSVNVCNNNIFGTGNGIDVRRFIRLSVPSQGVYTISANRSSGSGNRDPDILVFQNEDLITGLDSNQVNTETGDVNLSAGDYILEVYDYNHVTQENSGLACFSVSVTNN